MEAKEELQANCDDSESEESESATSSVSESTNWKELADDLRTDIECLLDLQSLIEFPFLDVQKMESGVASTQTLKPNATYQPYVNLISYRFPDAQPELVHRLAKANWDRFSRIQSDKGSNITSGNDVGKETATVFRRQSRKSSNSHESDAGLETSHATESMLAEAIMWYMHRNRGPIKTPGIPKEAKNEDGFECLSCSRRDKIVNDSAWK